MQARVTLLPELLRGRRLLTTGQYRPHIVIGPQSQRAAICEGNVCKEKYLGVMFVGGPDAMEPGDTADVKLALMYFPEEPYNEVQLGATFTVREGPLVVGGACATGRAPGWPPRLPRSGGSAGFRGIARVFQGDWPWPVSSGFCFHYRIALRCIYTITLYVYYSITL